MRIDAHLMDSMILQVHEPTTEYDKEEIREDLCNSDGLPIVHGNKI